MCAGLIAPQLFFAAAPPREFKAVECYETSMQSDKVLYLDHFSTIIIWSGADTDTDEHDTIRQAALDRAQAAAASRTPQPLGAQAAAAAESRIDPEAMLTLWCCRCCSAVRARQHLHGSLAAGAARAGPQGRPRDPTRGERRRAGWTVRGAAPSPARP